MKKFFGYVIIALLLFSTLNFAEAAVKKKKVVSTKHKIEFVTRDKFILVGDLYLADSSSDKPLVVCLHSFSLNSKAWKDMAEKLRLKGYNVLAMDLRGHGRSVYNEELKLKSRFYYKQDAWQKLPKDMIDAIKYVNANYPKVNCEDIIIMGADIGANAGMIGAMSLKKVPNKIVLISPMLKFKGLAMPVGSSKFVDTKIFMALAKTDRILINFGTKTKPIVKYYPIGGPGNHLIRANKDAFEDIFNFIVN